MQPTKSLELDFVIQDGEMDIDEDIHQAEDAYGIYLYILKNFLSKEIQARVIICSRDATLVVASSISAQAF